MTDKNLASPNETQPSPKTQPLLQKGRAQNPHDAFFKDAVANIAHATALLRYVLPSDIATTLNWDTMEPQKDTFITPAGRELRADALFKIFFKEAGKDDYVYLLLEHKSYQDSGINIQLKNYSHHISYRTHSKQKVPHLVIPIVFYHGRARWKQPRQFRDTFPLPEKHRKMFIGFIPQTGAQDYLLFDALATELQELPSPLPKKLSLGLIGHIYHHVFQKIWQSPDEMEENFSFLANLSTISEDMAENIVYYLERHHKMKRDAVLKIINPAGKENAMLTYTEMKEELIQEGVQKGIQKGIQKGRQEGIEEGVQKGRQEGIEKGMRRGASEAMHNLARNMLTEGLALETIVRVTGLSEKDMRALR